MECKYRLAVVDVEGSGTDPMPGQSSRVAVTMEGILYFLSHVLVQKIALLRLA